MGKNLIEIPHHYGRKLFRSAAEVTSGVPFKLSFDAEKLVGHLETENDNVLTYSVYHSIKRDPNYLHWLATSIKNLSEKGQIIEIGCNNGELLDLLDNGNYSIIGIDPTIHSTSKSKHITLRKDFWNKEFVSKNKEYLFPDVIVARHVLEHIPNYDDFMIDIGTVAKDSTHLIIEVPDFQVNLKSNDVTPIFSEHIHYFTLPGLQKIMNKHGWYINNFHRNSYWGGTLILFLSRNGEVHNFNETASLIREAAINFQTGLDRNNKCIIAELTDRRQALGKGVAMLGIGNRALHLLAILPKDLPVDYYLDNDPTKKDMIIPYQLGKIDTFAVEYLSKIHTLFITAFGYERQLISQIKNQIKLARDFQIVLCDPQFRSVSLYDL